MSGAGAGGRVVGREECSFYRDLRSARVFRSWRNRRGRGTVGIETSGRAACGVRDPRTTRDLFPDTRHLLSPSRPRVELPMHFLQP